MMNTRSLLTPSGITARNCKPICAHASASAMLVLPLDASTTRSPHFTRPWRHAFSRMKRAMRSFVLPLGLRNSSLHHTGGSERSNCTGTSGGGAIRFKYRWHPGSSAVMAASRMNISGVRASILERRRSEQRLRMPRVVLAMSGGVDSSASAVLLKRQGFDMVGLFMRTGTHTHEDTRRDNKKGCCSAIDAGDARRVADRLDIPFYAIDFEAEFGKIIDYFADEYARGRTPNPCVVCNNWLKFGQLWAFGQKLGADFIATGHYAQAINGE